MCNQRYCENYLDENAPGYIVEYRGNFKEQIDKVDYACGDAITDVLAIVSVPPEKIEQLRRDVPAIIFIEFRSVYTLQDIPLSDVDKINAVKINPYLNLSGRGVIVGMVDSGIDYLNKEFTREDGTSRILSIWDQTASYKGKTNIYIGDTYSNEDINNAIKASKNGGNPYDIVPTKDDENHGTKMAGIIGARGYNKEIEGVARDCDFAIVKLLPSPNYRKLMLENGVPVIPVYNNSEVVAGVEYLKNLAVSLRRPMVIYIGVGGSEGSHDGNNITSRYLTSVASKRGVVLVTGTGNEGAAEGHVSNKIANEGEVDTVELVIPREIKKFSFYIWVQTPNRMSLNIIAPSGEKTNFINSKIYSVDERNFFLLDTKLTVTCHDPENFTGHQLYILDFNGIKSGIWKIEIKGDYIIDGRYDIWLPIKRTLPEGTRFLRSNPYNTLTIPSTARNVVTVAYYDSTNNSLIASSGKGFNTNYVINPDIATAGVNIFSTSNSGTITTVSGSSAATSIVAGACALLLQWGIIDGNDTTMYSTKIRSYLIYGAERDRIYEYPNEDIGYGRLDVLEIFTILGGNYRHRKFEKILGGYSEYYVKNLFIRIPNNIDIKGVYL